MNPAHVPEITPEAFGELLKNGSSFVVLDVREPSEVGQVHLEDPRVVYTPMSRLAYDGLDALPEEINHPDKEIIVICHHGIRSRQVTGWLRSQGWANVQSLRGGVDTYALLVDPSIGRYY
jgi:rhodanese-related sulfurtransferase